MNLGHLTYLVMELGWGLPVVAVQWTVGRRRLWRRRSVVALAVGLPTLYLSLADSIAIDAGIWRLDSAHIVGIRIGVLPVEEVIFFLLTNAMVVQTVVWVLEGRRGPRPAPHTVSDGTAAATE